MPQNEALSQRIRDSFTARRIKNEEKKMFGGSAYMVRGNMTVGVTNKGEFMVRIHPDEQAAALKRPGARIMEFTGRPMKGFLFISQKGYEQDRDLEAWIDMAMRYNQKLPAKTAVKKKPAKGK